MARGDLVGLAVAPDGTAAVYPRGPSPLSTPGKGGETPLSPPSPGEPGTDRRAPGPPAYRAGASPLSTPLSAPSPGEYGWVVSVDEVAAADAEIRPRWATWSQESAARLTARGVRLATCWDVAAVHRLQSGGFRADPGWAWAHLKGLPLDAVPTRRQGELFGSVNDGLSDDEAVGPAGYLNPEWADGGWADSPARMVRWAQLALEAARIQHSKPGRDVVGEATVRSESGIELLCAELAHDGLPVSRPAAEGLLADIIGPRPRTAAEAARARSVRDERVLRHAPAGVAADLRSPLQVKSLLKAAGIDVPDTRAWRLEQFRDASPLVAALLEWRKAERIATTYGYGWLDTFLGPDGRLRGEWTGSDGAAGRMTASAGLHNMPAILRRAVLAEDGHVFVRADLGQIEPRVLAAVSGDRALVAATAADDLYLPVAGQLSVDRPTAKVAMIAAMYGQTTGHGGQAARRMKATYPVAMGYLDDADRRAQAGRDLRTYGGRLVRMSGGGTGTGAGTEPEPAARVAGRGRYGRNAMIQGAAAELFKMWAVTVRARGAALDARIVLCLHDELLVHVAEHAAGDAEKLLGDCLAETVRRWAPGSQVRFLADIAIVRCWADAKATGGTDTVTGSISGQEGA